MRNLGFSFFSPNPSIGTVLESRVSVKTNNNIYGRLGGGGGDSAR
jgi:hypothetical protein